MPLHLCRLAVYEVDDYGVEVRRGLCLTLYLILQEAYIPSRHQISPITAVTPTYGMNNVRASDTHNFEV